MDFYRDLFNMILSAFQTNFYMFGFAISLFDIFIFVSFGGLLLSFFLKLLD